MKTTKRYLDGQRMVGDEKADSLIQAVFSAGEQHLLYALLKDGGTDSQPQSTIRKFIMSRRPQPRWYDHNRLKKGQILFKQYALEIMTLLGSMSLPYCYAASPGNKALYLSDKMRASPGKRLMDTASFVISVLTPGSFDDHGNGFASINKVRLIHALSRYHLTNHSTWDMQWGQPINQEDMAGTNLAFSYIILLGMQQSGFVLSLREKEDFLFAWRYIGYLMGIGNDLLPVNLKEAGALNTIIKGRNLKKTSEGIALTAELIQYYKAIVSPSQAELIPSQIRLNLGNEIAGYVGLNSDPLADRLTSFVNSMRSIKNILSIAPESYQQMISRHRQLAGAFGKH